MRHKEEVTAEIPLNWNRYYIIELRVYIPFAFKCGEVGVQESIESSKYAHTVFYFSTTYYIIRN